MYVWYINSTSVQSASMTNQSSVVLIGDYDYHYPREKNIREGLEHHGITVYDCQFSEEQRFIRPIKILLIPIFYLRTWIRIRQILQKEPDPDALFVTKFNPLILPLVWIFSRRLDCPLVYDLFVSLSRTAEMRGVNTFLVRFIWAIEYLALRLPDYNTVGTNQFIQLYSKMYSVPKNRFIRLPPGADEEWYYPLENLSKQDKFTAVYWGNFLPHHGVEIIVEAARILEKRGRDKLKIVFVGKGPQKQHAEYLAAKYGLNIVQFEGFVPMEELQHWIGSSHVALGVFSADKRAMASITNKVSEGVAMRKAVITERSPAIEEWFENKKSIYMIPPEDPEALADAIEECKSDPELVSKIERGAYDVYKSSFSQPKIGEILVEKLRL